MTVREKEAPFVSHVRLDRLTDRDLLLVADMRGSPQVDLAMASVASRALRVLVQ